MSYGGEYGGSTLPPAPPPAAQRWGNGPSRNALRNVVNVFRLRTPNLDADGAQTGGGPFNLLWSNLACMVTPKRIVREGADGAIIQETGFSVMFGLNPGIQVGDRILWVDDISISHTLSVTGVRNMAGRSTAWLVDAVEVKGS